MKHTAPSPWDVATHVQTLIMMSSRHNFNTSRLNQTSWRHSTFSCVWTFVFIALNSVCTKVLRPHHDSRCLLEIYTNICCPLNDINRSTNSLLRTSRIPCPWTARRVELPRRRISHVGPLFTLVPGYLVSTDEVVRRVLRVTWFRGLKFGKPSGPQVDDLLRISPSSRSSNKMAIKTTYQPRNDGLLSWQNTTRSLFS